MPDPRVVVDVATTLEHIALIERLSPFYIYDFSEMEPAGSDRFEFDDTGSLGQLPYLDQCLADPTRRALVIRIDGRPAGFALINTHSHRGGAVERNMAEFFVVRKHRRVGAASEAVRRVLALYPGRWEVAVVQRNTAALSFWPRAIASAPNVSDIVKMDGPFPDWNGPIWTFQAHPPA